MASVRQTVVKTVTVAAGATGATLFDSDADLPVPKPAGHVLRLIGIGYDMPSGIANFTITFDDKAYNYGTYQLGLYDAPAFFDPPLHERCGKIMITCDNTDTVDKTIRIRVDVVVSAE